MDHAFELLYNFPCTAMDAPGSVKIICLRLVREHGRMTAAQDKAVEDVVCEPTSSVFSPQKSSSLESAPEMYR